MATKTKDKYIEAIGRRKTSIARVRLTPASKNDFLVNDKKLEDVFPTEALQVKVREALETIKPKEKFKITVKTYGGGIVSQAEAIRLGIARALVSIDSDSRQPLKQKGFLKRDPRIKERKKFGRKKARKSPQWSKR